MYKISIQNSDIVPEEFIDLSKSVGWGANKNWNLDEVQNALNKTALVVTIRNEKGKLIGCGRVLSDGLLFTTIPDIFVRPEYQRQGIGTMIMEVIKEHFRHTPIFFGSQSGNETFFEKLGFEKGIQSYQGKFK